MRFKLAAQLQAMIFVLAVVALSATAQTLPADGDAWTEYVSATEAGEGGWSIEDDSTQMLRVSTAHQVGSYSVGCQTTVASWCDPFWLERAVDLREATDLVFAHRASWSGRPFKVRLRMEPTLAEIITGISEKRILFRFDTSATWTQFSANLADGEWAWYDGSWQASGGNLELTRSTRIEWTACIHTSIESGDLLLIDGLHLDLEPTAASEATWGGVKSLYR